MAQVSQLSLFDETTSTTTAAPAPAVQPPAPVSRHPKAQREIRFGQHLVAYELRRARRKTIGFIVGVAGLSVSAPRWVGVGEIETALQSKATWILRKLQEQRERSRR